MIGSLVARQIRRAGDVGLQRGVQGNGAWLAVGVVGLGFRLLTRWWRKEEVIWRAELAPGERLEIGHLLETFRDLGEKPPR
ncbi:MAG: hypothetical protein AAFZ07_20805 [Actinomycetota bacterium]